MSTLALTRNDLNRFGLARAQRQSGYEKPATRQNRAGRVFGARSYAAAAINRLTADFTTTNVSPDTDLILGLRTMRARSRQLAKNDPYMRRFLRLVDKNVIGPAGIALNVDGFPEVETAWYDWSRPKTATATRQMSLNEAFKLAMRTQIVDGECLIRPLFPFKNDYGYTISFIPTDCLDEDLNDEMRKIRMGVERDEWGAPLAYHLHKLNPVDWYSGASSVGPRERISSSEIIHLRQVDAISQTRGVPWMHAALMKVNMLDGYSDAELVAARVSAAKLGFIIPGESDEYNGDGEQMDGAKLMDAEPGTWEILSKGSTVQPWDPQHPNASFAAFVNVMLRGIACAADVSYHSLTGDLSQVNYSSARIGLLDERDTWSMLQQHFIEHVAEPIFEGFKEALMLSKRKTFSPLQADSVKPSWRPRRWAWVDPQKEISAAQQAVDLCVKSRKQIIEEQGGDSEVVWTELDAETKRLKTAGLLQEVQQPTQPATEPVVQE